MEVVSIKLTDISLNSLLLKIDTLDITNFYYELTLMNKINDNPVYLFTLAISTDLEKNEAKVLLDLYYFKLNSTGEIILKIKKL